MVCYGMLWYVMVCSGPVVVSSFDKATLCDESLNR